MSELTQNERVAIALGSHAQQVAFAIDRFNSEPEGVIIRSVLADRLQQQLNEQLRKLRSVTAEELKTVQGKCDAIELAIGTVSKPLS